MEFRRCLSVSAVVERGDLRVTGQADGGVEIVATAAETYQVSDNGVVIGTFSGVNDDIKVKLEDSAGTGNSVTIDLAQQTADQIVLDLGGGDNTATVRGGTAGSVRFAGHDGDDSLILAADATVTKSVEAYLGDGDNALTVEGKIGRWLEVRAKDGDDALTIAAGASVARAVYASLGDGDNTTTIGGSIGRLALKGGVDNDLVEILAGAAVARSVHVYAGGGDNSLTVAGAVSGSVNFDGRGGDDSVQITADGTIGRNVNVRLGGGVNTFTHEGAIEGNLRVVSASEDDVFTVADTATVGGNTQLLPGEQYEHHRPGCSASEELAPVSADLRAAGLRGSGAARRR